MLISGPECFLTTWESKAEARSIRLPETGAAATSAYNTAMTATDSHAARAAGAGEGCQSNAHKGR